MKKQNKAPLNKTLTLNPKPYKGDEEAEQCTRESRRQDPF
jgi:hypothetical protein